jgi:TolA-binding protein|tara:strand:- start:5 stop:286 length:282 start_codon:yes stop_codon:yes gene_type:complete
MEGNYIQLQQKLQNMKININEINRIIEKKTEMIVSLKEQQKEINKKIQGEESGLNENVKKKDDMEKTLIEATNSYKQLEDAVSSILNMINNKC